MSEGATDPAGDPPVGSVGAIAGRDEGHPSCGLRPVPETLSLLWDLHVSAVAADIPALEMWPPAWSLGPDGSLHYSAIALLGLAIGELFDLDELAEHCAVEGTYEVSFTSMPMRVVGGVASPANALAIL